MTGTFTEMTTDIAAALGAIVVANGIPSEEVKVHVGKQCQSFSV